MKTGLFLQSVRVSKVVESTNWDKILKRFVFVFTFQSFIVISFRRLEPRLAARAVQKNITSDEDNERRPLLHWRHHMSMSSIVITCACRQFYCHHMSMSSISCHQLTCHEMFMSCHVMTCSIHHMSCHQMSCHHMSISSPFIVQHNFPLGVTSLTVFRLQQYLWNNNNKNNNKSVFQAPFCETP